MLSVQSGKTRHITLIDPDKQTPEVAAKRALVAVECGTAAIFVGGSTDTGSNIVDATCEAIQDALELATFAASQHPDADEETWDIPVILFPGGAHAMSARADGILFMMLMNSTNRRFLIEEQLTGAPYIAKAGLQTIPTGYVVCAPGGAVGEVGEAKLIEAGDGELVSAYCQTAEMYGFTTVYLEAGSGASSPVSTDFIRIAKSSMDCTLIIGGGIRTPEQMKAAAEAGADYIVTGTITEEFGDLKLLKERLQSLIGVL
ncbi:MAG: phosphoglycerol geranylgeranyltransferase [Methanobacteriota archaeon]|nr:MAG: phosphoglycerol geranylgeranyltransferase [Euryarchaeota archaeon TMED103]RAH11840.1 MAG: phosphoglycerol geranylgeranyltransferase [Euryarchaeota archaeon]